MSSINFAKVMKLIFSLLVFYLECGPGCNHQNSHYLTTYGKNFENSWFFRPKPSIYIQLSRKKIFFWKFGPKPPLGGPKTAKNWKKPRFWPFLIFYLENAKWPPFFYFIFPFHIGWANWKKNLAKSIHAKKKNRTLLL